MSIRVEIATALFELSGKSPNYEDNEFIPATSIHNVLQHRSYMSIRTVIRKMQIQGLLQHKYARGKRRNGEPYPKMDYYRLSKFGIKWLEWKKAHPNPY